MPSETTFPDLCDRYAAVLFDAYGVLVDGTGALPGAIEVIALLRRRNQQFLVVTNDASRSPERAAERFTRLGLNIRPGEVLSSGMLIAPALHQSGRELDSSGSAVSDSVALKSLKHLRVVVVGTADSEAYARESGALIVEPSMSEPADAVVIADEAGVDLLETMDAVLSMIIHAVRSGRPPRLLLANPDLIYPSGDGQFGFTAGSLALMIEHALQLVFGENAPAFEKLGKPAAPIFRAAEARLGTRDVVMIGDQLHTDIAGAQAAGIDSALLLGGVSDHRATAQSRQFEHYKPTWLLRSLK